MQVNEQKMCWALWSVKLRYGAGSLPSGAEAFPCLDRHEPSVGGYEIMLFSVMNQLSIKKHLSVDFSEPADKFIPLQAFAIRVFRQLLPYLVLERSQLGEQSLAFLF